MWDDDRIPSNPVGVTWGYKRPPVVPPNAPPVEDRLATRFGWNLSVVRGEQAATENGGSGAFSLIAPSVIATDTANPFEVLRLTRWRRFGNALTQIRNAFHVADRYGARRIEFPEPHPFFQGDEAGGVRLAWAPPVELSPQFAHLVPPRPGLVGDFYLIRGLGLRPPADVQAAIVTRYLRPLLAPAVRAPRADMDDGDVVLHFRSGDVFPAVGRLPSNPGYGQPPLAYYLAAVARERARRVWLVFEDRGNPTVGAAEQALRQRGIDVRMQSADLADDLNVLINARCLVASAGTFALSAAVLSTRMRKVYSFEPALQCLGHLGVDVVEASDRDGEYREAVMDNNWRATTEQRALMLSYPEEAIDFVDRPARGPAG